MKNVELATLPALRLAALHVLFGLGAIAILSQCVCFQSWQSVVYSAKPRWEAALRSIFDMHGHADDEYCMVATKDVGAVHLALVVRRELMAHIRKVRSVSVCAGFLGGLLPNKGAAAISCTIGEDSFLFVSAHLSPHTAAVAHRDWQFEMIDRVLHAKLIGTLSTCGAGLRCACCDSAAEGMTASAAFDFVFWMGDLNYRVECSKEEAKRLTM